MQYIDSSRFITSALSSIVNNPSEGIHKVKCRFGYNDKKYETCGITYEVCYYKKQTNFKDDLIECKFLFRNKNYQQMFDEELKERFLIHTNFLTTTIISFFNCCKKLFILMNIWMNGKKLTKHNYLKNIVFTIT